VLFIDEIHTVIGAGATSGGAMDASNLLKPALSSGAIRCIGSTTYKEYRQFFEKDRALVRRFQKIDVNEPSIGHDRDPQGAEALFRGVPQARYTNEAIKAAVELVGALHQRPQAAGQGDRRDRRDRRLADAAAEAKRRKTIGVKEIEATIATMARIPPKTVSKDDEQVLCQSRAGTALGGLRPGSGDRGAASAIKLARAGLREPKSRSAATCSPARPASARRKWPSSLPRRSASSCCASTCRNTWSATRSRG
jgi:ATP-dependent Clp protease ATP-binding subunit ClpA